LGLQLLYYEKHLRYFSEFFLKKLQLKRCGRRRSGFSTDKSPRVAELTVGHFQNRDNTFRRNHCFNPVDVHQSILSGSTVPDVDGKLHHLKSVLD